MRILFVVPYVPSMIRVRPYQFVRALARRHELTLVVVGSEAERGAAQALRAYCKRIELVPMRLSAAIVSCARAVVRREPLQAAVCQSPHLERRLDDLLTGERFDVAHVEHLRAAQVGLHLSDRLPTMFDAVDCISLLQQRTLRNSHSAYQRLLAALELRRTRAYEARLLRRFDTVAVTSPDDARALQALAPDTDVAVVPNGVDLEYFRPLASRPEPATLVFSGKMSYHANVTAVLHFVGEILPVIRERRPDVRLRIVGSRPTREVQALTRDPFITVLGHVPDIRPAIGAATLAICPVTVKVGIQNKVLEAMAMGVPVVSSREGAEGLAAEPGRDLLVADNPREFGAHVLHLLADADLRAQLARAGRRYVELHHRWDGAGHQLERLYQQAIQSSGRGIKAPTGLLLQ